MLELAKKKARPIGGLPEVGLGLQAVDRRRDQVGVVLQERDVVLVEAPVLPGIDLEHPPGRPLAAYHHVDHAPDAMLDEERGDLEAILGVGVGGDDRHVLPERVPAR